MNRTTSVGQASTRARRRRLVIFKRKKKAYIYIYIYVYVICIKLLVKLSPLSLSCHLRRPRQRTMHNAHTHTLTAPFPATSICACSHKRGRHLWWLSPGLIYFLFFHNIRSCCPTKSRGYLQLRACERNSRVAIRTRRFFVRHHHGVSRCPRLHYWRLYNN